MVLDKVKFSLYTLNISKDILIIVLLVQKKMAEDLNHRPNSCLYNANFDSKLILLVRGIERFLSENDSNLVALILNSIKYES